MTVHDLPGHLMAAGAFLMIMRMMGGRSLFPGEPRRRFRRAIFRHVHCHAVRMFVIAMRRGLLVRLGKSRRGDEESKQGGGTTGRAPL
ncbi:hypothetical protein AFIC_000841 [[Pseudomonas] carboxydohydrogena]|uniref:Uncharacterized protein n=1 Tax=Afipia carboxydohydrogena TaxID=290 RepID=A0ABY8BQT9_AFICR|nr:hypothetical protein [[Pseudomonas] carboxydohydrogena]WEF52360.1 hypothetical protein AFIC_000841 [[Pseudomonas] carboxydohydrogena]